MKIVEPNYDLLIQEAHRRWIQTRDPRDGDRFAHIILDAVDSDRRKLQHLHDERQ
jgi:hypothetical protein